MKINRDRSTYKPPYAVVLLDATDAYYFADVMDNMEVIETIEDFHLAKELANSLFVQKNYKWKSLQAMNEADGGYDVRIYDKQGACVYAAHESFKDNWIGSKKENTSEESSPNTKYNFTLHGKDAEVAYDAFFGKNSPSNKPNGKRRLKSKIMASIVIAAVVVGLWYWFEIRPSEIRKDCAQSLHGKDYSAALANNYYRLCLTQRGIKPESLFVNVGD